MIHAPTPATTHAPKRSSHRRTIRIGPPRARSVHSTATTASHSHLLLNPNTRIDIWFATSDMAQNSNPVHPTSCTMLRTDGRYDPRRPSTGRNRTIVGTFSREPASATSASGTHPISVPITIASSASGNPSDGTSSAPVMSTSRPIARSPHSTAKSRPLSLRCSGGTGRMPQTGASRSRTSSSRSVTVAT